MRYKNKKGGTRMTGAGARCIKLNWIYCITEQSKHLFTLTNHGHANLDLHVNKITSKQRNWNVKSTNLNTSCEGTNYGGGLFLSMVIYSMTMIVLWIEFLNRNESVSSNFLLGFREINIFGKIVITENP